MSQVVTFRLNLNMGGGQGVTAALATMRQQFGQATTSLTAFRNLLNAAPGTRVAQQQLGQNALRAELHAAEAGAGARAMATPAGQAALQRTAAAGGQQSLAGMRQQLAAGKAQAAYETSPAGQKAGAEMRRLRAEKEAQEESRRRRQVIDEYGKLGGGMMLFKEGLGKLVAGAWVASAAFYGVVKASEYASGLAAHADPSTARHLEASREALRIQAGRSFLDRQRQEQAIAQRMAEEARAEPGSTVRNLGRGAMAGGGIGRFAVELAASLPDWMRNQESLRREREIMQQGQPYMGPTPSRYLTPEQYGESLQMAASNTSALEAQNLQDQFNNFFGNNPQAMADYLRLMNESLQRIEENAGRFAPHW